MSVDRPDIHRVVEDRHAAIDRRRSDDDHIGGIFGVYVHSGRPVRRSSAVTVLGGSVMYITPSTTIGDVSTMPAAHLIDPRRLQPRDVLAGDLISGE